jgi:hypothetical protein
MSIDLTGNIMHAYLTAHNYLLELPGLSEFLAKFGSRTGLPEDLVGWESILSKA